MGKDESQLKSKNRKIKPKYAAIMRLAENENCLTGHYWPQTIRKPVRFRYPNGNIEEGDPAKRAMQRSLK
jgi:hypothetical protein